MNITRRHFLIGLSIAAIPGLSMAQNHGDHGSGHNGHNNSGANKPPGLVLGM